MKKTYIEPKNTVVALKVRDNVLSQISGTSGVDGLGVNDGGTSGNVFTSDSRETISAPDVWEEW